MQLFDAFFVVFIIMFSAVIHEVMHGYMADFLGDPTARLAGRLTLNPIPHLDPVGSIILPLFFTFTNSPLFFGWAKPVPYNPYNLRPGRFSEALVAGAGPASNLVIAVIFGAFIRLQVFDALVNSTLFYVVVVNVMLFLFNLIPVPPLDGSKVLESLLPSGLQHMYGTQRRTMEQNPLIGMAVVFAFIILLGGTFGSFVYTIARGIAGI